MIARHGVVLLLLGGAVWAVFGQTLGFEFLIWDDGRYVVDYPALRRGLLGDRDIVPHLYWWRAAADEHVLF